MTRLRMESVFQVTLAITEATCDSDTHFCSAMLSVAVKTHYERLCSWKPLAGVWWWQVIAPLCWFIPEVTPNKAAFFQEAGQLWWWYWVAIFAWWCMISLTFLHIYAPGLPVVTSLSLSPISVVQSFSSKDVHFLSRSCPIKNTNTTINTGLMSECLCTLGALLPTPGCPSGWPDFATPVRSLSVMSWAL